MELPAKLLHCFDSYIPVEQEDSEPPEKKSKLDSVDYDDCLHDIICVGTEKDGLQSLDFYMINEEFETYDGELQIEGDSLNLWKK